MDKEQLDGDQITYSITDVEIFSEGKWNGHIITGRHLDQIIQAYSETSQAIPPFLKLGHDDNQKLLQEDGLPAAGWVSNLRKVGKKLVADFTDVPKKIYELIKKKAYRKVSVEVFNGLEIEGKVYDKVLGAVALLGANTPGVMNLNDILAQYKFRDATRFDKLDMVRVYSFPFPIEDEGTDMDEIKKLQDELTTEKTKAQALEAEVTKFKADVQSKDAAIKELETYKSKALEAQSELAKTRIEKFVTELEGQKLCTKAMKPLVQALLEPEKEEYSVGEKKLSKQELLKEILSLYSKAASVNFVESSEEGDKDKRKDYSAEIEAYASEHKVSYKEAYKAVMRAKEDEEVTEEDTSDDSAA